MLELRAQSGTMEARFRANESWRLTLEHCGGPCSQKAHPGVVKARYGAIINDTLIPIVDLRKDNTPLSRSDKKNNF
jgi:hypothetical protein